jgi:hypothetical protein
MTSRPTRFGLALLGQGSVTQLTEEARRAEQIGFDVVLLPDHLGMTAPLPPLVAMAQAAPSVRVGNLVLNSNLRMLAPDASAAELRQLVTFLGGPVTEAADQIPSLRDEFGISYFTFNLTPSVSWETLEKLVAAVK